MDAPDIMTLEEVAAYLRLGPDNVRRLCEEGGIPGGRIGGEWRFRREEIEAWTTEQLSNMPSPPRVLPLSFTTYLDPDRVVILRATQKNEALQELVGCLKNSGKAGFGDELAAQLFYRESLMSTGIGMGVAVPHVRLAWIPDLVMAVGFAPEGLADYESLDGKPVRWVFMIVAGKNQHADYLRVMSCIASRLRDPEWLAGLQSARDAASLLEALKR